MIVWEFFFALSVFTDEVLYRVAPQGNKILQGDKGHYVTNHTVS